jgi:multidrug efflux pump subunit AcrB
MLVSSSGGTATLDSLATIDELPGQTEVRRETSSAKSVTARLEGVDLGTGIAAVQKLSDGTCRLPFVYTADPREQQKSFADLLLVLVLAIVLVFLVLLFDSVRSPPVAILSSAILSTSGVFLALLVTRTTFNVSSFMGLIMVIIVAKTDCCWMPTRSSGADSGRRRHHSGRPAAAAHRDDGVGGRGGMVPLALALGAGSQMLQPLAIAVIGGLLISMLLSLIVTPAIQFFLTAPPARRVSAVT